MSDSEKIATMWPWFNGNGNIGAKDRLQTLENYSNGKEQCNVMKAVIKHDAWHEKMAGRRWELYVGFAVVVLAQVLSSIFLGGS